MRYLLLWVLLFITLRTSAQDFSFSRKGLRTIEDAPANTNLDVPEHFNIHFQTTYIYQYKPAFTAPYEGPNSLDSNEEKENSLTATLYLGLRLWKGAELYVNPEIAGGSGLSGALGMAGSSNGETFRVGNPAPTLYIARTYLTQTFALRNTYTRKNGIQNSEYAEGDANQLGGYSPKNYLRLYAGKFCLGDLFDNNEYSNSPRTQFMNWALMNNGAWDYAANVRGYTISFVSELQLGNWNGMAGIALMPVVANGAKLNDDLGKAYAINAEFTRAITISHHPGNIRLLGYYNTSDHMGRYKDALSIKWTTPEVDIVNPGQYKGYKYGFGINFDQELSKTFGIFGRIGWNDGTYQTWCFTEIDKTVSLGLSANGSSWKRPDDNCGIAVLVNGISDDHKRYLQSGGSGFILGDGRLNYSPEVIGELYYSFKPVKTGIWVSGDYQFCMNPGYNADRGPVHILSARVHVEL
jgi:high affinity Mn2+ porin